VAVVECAAQSLGQGVISAMLLGIKSSSSSLDRSYASKEQRRNPEAIAEMKGLLPGNLLGFNNGH